MKQFLYKVLISIVAIVLIYELTLGKLIASYSDKINYISTKEGRKELVISLRKEIEKANKKDRYLSEEDAKLLSVFLKKIQKEIIESQN